MEGKTGNLFSNPFLQALTSTSPTLILSMYIPVVLGLPILVSYQFAINWSAVVPMVFLGAITWTLTEYWLHRKLFHWVGESKWAQRFHYLVHGYHHTYPRDKEHLFMPIIPSLLLATIFCLLYYTILGAIGLVFFAGFLGGYLVYSSMHYSIHTITNPPKWLRPLWRHHHLHHSTFPNKAFGVSSSLWDKVFNTLPHK